MMIKDQMYYYDCQDLIINGADIDLVSYTHEQNSGHLYWQVYSFGWNAVEFIFQKSLCLHRRIYSDFLPCDATGVLG